MELSEDRSGWRKGRAGEVVPKGPLPGAGPEVVAGPCQPRGSGLSAAETATMGGKNKQRTKGNLRVSARGPARAGRRACVWSVTARERPRRRGCAGGGAGRNGSAPGAGRALLRNRRLGGVTRGGSCAAGGRSRGRGVAGGPRAPRPGAPRPGSRPKPSRPRLRPGPSRSHADPRGAWTLLLKGCSGFCFKREGNILGSNSTATARSLRRLAGG